MPRSYLIRRRRMRSYETQIQTPPEEDVRDLINKSTRLRDGSLKRVVPDLLCCDYVCGTSLSVLKA
jgi:hypothetical protein